MIDYKKAEELTLGTCLPLGAESLPIEQAIGRVPTDDIISPINVSPFRNSAMDGFAVSSGQLEHCSSDRPVTLPVAATLFAGSTLKTNYDKSVAVKVMTGGPVPDEYDSVVMVEKTKFDEQTVTFENPSPPGTNVRGAGEDVAIGELLFSAGQRLGVFDIGLLAGIGMKDVTVHKQPSVLIVTTGDELQEPGQPLSSGRIYNSNKYTLFSMVRNFCQPPDIVSCVSDRYDDLVSNLDRDYDVIITSGGVSAGDRDLVVSAAGKCGWQQVFHKVSIKPGKPVFFAQRNHQVLFGLPGNPLSATVTCAVFVLPALKKMAGCRDYRLVLDPAQLHKCPPRKGDRMLIWPGRIWSDDGKILAAYSEKKSSASLSALRGSDGLIFQQRMTESDAVSTDVKIVRWQQLFGS
jgi:molybdopterin molybdotransferase